MEASDDEAVIPSSNTKINAVDEEEEERWHQHVEKRLCITVIVDWKRCNRGIFWPEVLERVEEKSRRGVNPLKIELTLHQFADQLAKPISNTNRTPGRKHILQHCDVLIINWDAINGDPNFGAHIPFHWLEQQGRREILVWVKNGGILIVEGQATLSVPTQKAYDALLGSSEVSVCGAEDELDPGAQVKRVGYTCKMTNLAHNCKLFAGLSRLDSTGISRTHEDMFPDCAPFITLHELEGTGWNLLYRGWFRWIVPFRRRRLRWVPLIKTAHPDRRWNHPTMLVAKHGDGAIFVSTMFLASSGQVDLISHLLRCHGKTDQLPSPSLSASTLLQQHIIKVLWPIVVTVFALLMAGNSPILQGVATWILLVVGSLIFAALGYLLRRLGLKKFLEENISWR